MELVALEVFQCHAAVQKTVDETGTGQGIVGRLAGIRRLDPDYVVYAFHPGAIRRRVSITASQQIPMIAFQLPGYAA